MRTLAIVLMVLLVKTGSAQTTDTPWTLEQCVQYAIENNISIKQQALNVNYRENQLFQSKLDLAPSLNASMGQNFMFGKSTNYDNTYKNVNSQSTSFDLSTNVVLFNGLAKQSAIKQRNFELKTALLDLEKTKDDISLAIATAYLEILFNKELVNTTKEQIMVTTLLLENNKKQVEAGAMAKGKLYETESQLANEELTLTNYENQLRLSMLNLMQLLEVPVSDTFNIVTPVIEMDSIATTLLTTDSVFARAIAERPEILSKEMSLLSMEQQEKIAKAQLYPTLSAFASYSNYYNNKYVYSDPTHPNFGETMSFTDQKDLNAQKIVGLSLRVPIFNGFTAQTSVKNAKISYENSKYELQQQKNTLLKEIQQVHQNAVAAMKKYYSSEKAVESATEAFRYIEEKYNLGIVTPLEYNDAKNKVTNAQSSYIQAKYEYIFRIKILDFYNGLPITL